MKHTAINPSGIYRQALRLAVPMMIQNGITNAVSLVDNLMVGSLGTESMTAVSIAGSLLFVFSLAVFGGMSGPGIYGAQYYGQKNEKGIRDIFRLKYWIGMSIAIIGILIFLLAGQPLLKLYLQGEASGIDAGMTLSLGHEYLRIMLIGLVPFVITQIYAGSLRETNESVKPMVAGIVSVGTDVFFNWLLIYGKLELPALGVRGAAIATVIARFVEMIVIILWAHSDRAKHSFLKRIYSTMLVPLKMTRDVVVKGLPIFLNEILWSGGMAFITQCFSLRGLQVIAATNISNALCNLFNVVFIAMGSAVGIIIGQLLGASEFERVRKEAVHLMWFTTLLTTLVAIVLIAGAWYFPLLYNTLEEVRRSATTFIILTAIFFPVQGYLNALYFTLRAGGKTIIAFLYDSVFTWVITIPIAFVLCRYTEWPVFLIFIATQSCDLLKVLFGRILFKRDVWITNLVAED